MMRTKKIEELKKQLTENLQDVKGRLHEDTHLETTELSHYDNHPADSATDLTDQHTEMAIERHKEEELEQINVALQAVADGTYGTCTVCGKEIPFERLEVVPTSLTCIEHATQDVETDSRPPEEAILGSSTEHPFKDEGGIRDYQNSFEDVENFGSSDSPQDVSNEEQKDFYKI